MGEGLDEILRSRFYEVSYQGTASAAPYQASPYLSS